MQFCFTIWSYMYCIRVNVLIDNQLVINPHTFGTFFILSFKENIYLQKINPPTFFCTFFIQVDAPFETIRYCGFEWWNNCVQCWFPKWFWNTPRCSVSTIQNHLNGSTACNTVQMVSPCVYKTNGHFWKWKF